MSEYYVVCHGAGKLSLGLILRIVQQNITLIFFCRKQHPWTLVKCHKKIKVILEDFSEKEFASYEIMVFDESIETVDRFLLQCQRLNLAGIIITDNCKIKNAIYEKAIANITCCGSSNFPVVYKDIMSYENNKNKPVYAFENDHKIVRRTQAESNNCNAVLVTADCISASRLVDFDKGEIRIRCEREATVKVLDVNNIFQESSTVRIINHMSLYRESINMEKLRNLLNSKEIKSRSKLEITQKKFSVNIPHSLVAINTLYYNCLKTPDYKTPLEFRNIKIFEGLNQKQISTLKNIADSLVMYNKLLAKIGHPSLQMETEKNTENPIDRFLKANQDEVGRILSMDNMCRFQNKLKWLLKNLGAVLAAYSSTGFAFMFKIEETRLSEYINLIEKEYKIISEVLAVIEGKPLHA